MVGSAAGEGTAAESNVVRQGESGSGHRIVVIESATADDDVGDVAVGGGAEGSTVGELEVSTRDGEGGSPSRIESGVGGGREENAAEPPFYHITLTEKAA